VDWLNATILFDRYLKEIIRVGGDLDWWTKKFDEFCRLELPPDKWFVFVRQHLNHAEEYKSRSHDAIASEVWEQVFKGVKK
jgi:hypothetical protein